MKKDERLDQILRHAAKVFYEKGFDRASIRDIARDAQMSLAGLYYYFSSKDELLFLIQKEVFTELLEMVEARIEKETDPELRLAAFITNHLDYFLANLVEMKVLSHEYECLKGDQHAQIADLRRRYYETAEAVVAPLVGRRQDSRLSSRVATLSLMGMMNWIYTWYRPDRDGPPDEVAAQMADLFLKGVG